VLCVLVKASSLSPTKMAASYECRSRASFCHLRKYASIAVVHPASLLCRRRHTHALGVVVSVQSKSLPWAIAMIGTAEAYLWKKRSRVHSARKQTLELQLGLSGYGVLGLGLGEMINHFRITCRLETTSPLLDSLSFLSKEAGHGVREWMFYRATFFLETEMMG
jgi:hypothetical protein